MFFTLKSSTSGALESILPSVVLYGLQHVGASFAYDLTRFPKQYLIPSHVAVVAVNCRIMLAVLRWPVSSATRIFLQDVFGLSHFSLTVFLEFSKEAIPTMLEAANLATKSYCIHICCWTCLYFLWLFFSITLFIYLLQFTKTRQFSFVCQFRQYSGADLDGGFWTKIAWGYRFVFNRAAVSRQVFFVQKCWISTNALLRLLRGNIDLECLTWS